tara:strand:+ start:1330 stop:1914 length:585 start_codon:yes stop_codon:yes gene_type:complete
MKLFSLFSLFTTSLAFSKSNFLKSTFSKTVKIVDVDYVSKNNTFDCGAIEPLGFWDPLGVTKKMDARLEKYMREAEQHHGRIAMLTSIGLPVLDLVDGDELAINAYNNHPNELLFVTFFSYEIARLLIQYENPKNMSFRLKEDVYPGNVFNYNVTQLSRDLVNKELSNGRLAMIASLGYMLQELVTQQKIFTHI